MASFCPPSHVFSVCQNNTHRRPLVLTSYFVSWPSYWNMSFHKFLLRIRTNWLSLLWARSNLRFSISGDVRTRTLTWSGDPRICASVWVRGTCDGPTGKRNARCHIFIGLIVIHRIMYIICVGFTTCRRSLAIIKRSGANWNPTFYLGAKVVYWVCGKVSLRCGVVSSIAFSLHEKGALAFNSERIMFHLHSNITSCCDIRTVIKHDLCFHLHRMLTIIINNISKKSLRFQ